jgi:hypothetical protein
MSSNSFPLICSLSADELPRFDPGHEHHGESISVHHEATRRARARNAGARKLAASGSLEHILKSSTSRASAVPKEQDEASVEEGVR